MITIKKIWKGRHMLRYIHKTIYFNFRCLPFWQAIKLPIWLYRPKLIACNGKIIIEGSKMEPGMIRLGFNTVSIYPCNGVMIENHGTVVFKGACNIGNDSYLSVGKSGKVVFGDKFVATASFKLASYSGCKFGDKVSIGWNCMFIDTDFHRLTRNDGKPVKAYGKICVGSNVWFGNNCIIQKNTRIPNYITIASGTMLNKPVMSPEAIVIGNKRSVDILQTGVWRNFGGCNLNCVKACS